MANTRSLRTGISLTTRDFKSFAKALRKAEDELYKETRRAVRAAGDLVRDEARRRASFSTRIPKSIKTRTSGVASVSVIAGGSKAPNAAPIENDGKGNVRHPTYGHTPWTSKNSPPAFLTPAVHEKAEETFKLVVDALDRAVEVAVTDDEV